MFTFLYKWVDPKLWPSICKQQLIMVAKSHIATSGL